MYEMKEEYYTGIEFVDKEHAKLFAYAEEIYQLLHEDFLSDKYDHILEVLQKLKDYTVTHFAHEEEYMESIQYKRMFSQKTQHEAFIKKLEEFDLQHMDDQGNQDEIITDVLKFLTDWLIDHILYLDKQIGK